MLFNSTTIVDFLDLAIDYFDFQIVLAFCTLISGIAAILYFGDKWKQNDNQDINNIQDKWEQNENQDISNIRDKAALLNEGIMKDLKTRAIEIKKHIKQKDYISFRKSSIKAILKFNDCEFAAILDESGIFKVKDNKISLIYINDRILIKHADIIIQNLEMFQNTVFELKDLIESLIDSDIPAGFENKLRILIKEDTGEDCLDKGKRLKEFLFITYLVSVSGSENSYKNGRTCIINIIQKRYDDLHNIIMGDPKSKDLCLSIEHRMNNIQSCLNDLINEIEYLHEDWQNKLII